MPGSTKHEASREHKAASNTAKPPLLPTRNALAKAGSPDECAAATSKADIAAGGTPEKPLLLLTRKALAKGGSRDEYATAAIKACLAAGGSPQACAAVRAALKA